ncbi:MAG TPA: alpha/beta fold hydrolase, partial [Dehalococcoidia bacterium]
MSWLAGHTTSILVVAVVVAAAASAAVLAIAAYSAHTVVRPRRDWQPADWRPPQHQVEAVYFQNRAGDVLHGWLLPPAARGAIVIVCHGFGTNRREGQDLLPWLHAAGYGALLFDFQAHGQSTGRYTTVGVREVDDLLSAVRFLQERFGPDVPLVGIGFSMGASVLILAAAQCKAIRAIVAD